MRAEQNTTCGAALCLSAAILIGVAAPLQAGEEADGFSGWPVEWGDYRAWSLQWELGGKASGNDGGPVAGDNEQVSLDWDPDRAELVDIWKTIQWLGAVGDEWNLKLSSADAYIPRARSPSCFRSTTACETA